MSEQTPLTTQIVHMLKTFGKHASPLLAAAEPAPSRPGEDVTMAEEEKRVDVTELYVSCATAASNDTERGPMILIPVRNL